MPRPKFKPSVPKHVDPEKMAERAKDACPKKIKPRVVLGTDAARALGIGR